MSNSLRAPISSSVPISRWIAAVFVAIAACSSAVSFCGWLFDIPALRGFGIDSYPLWPLTALGYIALSLGYLAWLLGRPRVATGLWTVPIAIALSSIFQNMTGIALGTDTLLFGDLLATYDFQHPGRPGLNPVTLFLLLGGAGFATRAHNGRMPEFGGLMATVAVSLAAAAGILIMLSRPGDPTPVLSTPIPSAITAASLVTAFVMLNGDLRWVRTLAEGRPGWRIMRVLLPAALILPVLPSVLQMLLLHNRLLSPTTGEALVVLSNVLIVSLIVWWALTRVAQEQAAMAELTEALDVTTLVITTPEGIITHWSDGCRALYGWTAAEALGQNKYALLRSRCEGPAGLPRQRDRGSVELVETCRDGREIAVIERVRSMASPGRAPLIVLDVTDVSDRAAAVEAMIASEERLAIATSTHELGIFEWDAATGRIEWSAGTEQRLGLVPGSIADFDSWRAQIEPEDFANIMRTIEDAVRDRGSKFSFRYRFVRPNGGVRAVEGSARIFYDANGCVSRTVGAMIDTTARDDRETALRRREAQLQSILATVPDAMVVIDECGTVLQFSAAAETLWGYGAADVVGRPATMLVPEDLRESHMATLQRYVSTREGLVGRAYWATALSANGRRFPVEIRVGVAHIDERILLTMFVSNMSEQLETEARLSELNAEIAHVSRQSAMSELAADLAHELNQPLAATSNFLAAARILSGRGDEPEKVADLLRMANEQTQRAGEIIRRMRAFMARGEVEMHAESVDRTVRDAAELVLVGTAQFGIRVTYQLDPAAPLIFADRIQVQQVIVNLMRNAMEALRNSQSDDRQIILSSHKFGNDMVEIAVSDNGPGIPAQVLEHLFSRFTTTKTGGGGMGIGLSISKRIIEAHGGTLSAENRSEGGASFRFTLPTVEQGVE